MNLLLLHSSAPCLLLVPGRSETLTSWLSSNISCQECGVPVSTGSGVVCGNFGKARESGVTCNGAWHGTCYKQSERDSFPVLQSCYLEESLLGPEAMEEDDPNQFKCAWDGGHLMCPFQCDACHFYNIQWRGPGAKLQDEVLLMCIQRANLNAFWSWETVTVLANWPERERGGWSVST